MANLTRGANGDKMANLTREANGNKKTNWVSINLPEDCTNVCIFFDEKTARFHIENFGAKPLYGLDGKKEDWLPMEVFITYGGNLASSQRHLEA